jgi:type IV pilus assembly protein PilC
MKKFTYEARHLTTKKNTNATVQADSENAAARLLIDQGFTPLNIKEQVENDGFLARLSGRITTNDKIVFTRQLATLIGAGLPLAQSLSTVMEQTQNKKLQSIVQEITASVEGGKSLSDSFSKHANVFDPVFLALVSAGEMSGTLDDALQRVANQQEKDAAVASKIKSAMTYPVIVLIVIVVVLVFMLLTVVPQVEKLYKSLGQKLPGITQIMVNGANFLVNFWWIVLIAIALGIYFFIQYLKTESGIRFKDTMKLKLPIINPLFRKLYMGRFMRTGQTLLSTGVSMLDMLKITAKAVNNTVIEKSILRAADKVRGGKALSVALQPEAYIMPLVPQMIKVGEQSGRVDEMMGKTAQVYEDELDAQVKNISTIIEPALMVVLALVAGFMVAAILLPIYSLVNNITV